MFSTNAYHLSAATAAAIDQQRWQIVLCCKAMKQHLKSKTV